jgi:hypothetical protein
MNAWKPTAARLIRFALNKADPSDSARALWPRSAQDMIQDMIDTTFSTSLTMLGRSQSCA